MGAVKPGWDNVVRQPEHEPLGPYVVRRQTTGALVIVDRRIKALGAGIVATYWGEAAALAEARRLAAAEGVAGRTWEGE